ncbi:MAG: hypothetical protein KAI79_08185 [Bacteroidales bacterium]|nr:hypothetical protein [Bacteroidales bacterium]
MMAKSLTQNTSKELYNYTHKFFKNLSVPHQGNFREIFRGIFITGSTHLSKISRTNNTGNRERSDISRLSKALETMNTEEFHKTHISHTMKKYENEPVLILSDGGDIQKPTAYKMEKVCSAVDGSKGHRIGKGYPAHGTMAYGIRSENLSPLSFHIHSTKEEGFKSEFNEQQKIFSLISSKTNPQIKPSDFDRIFVEDRGCDSQKRYLYFLNTLKNSFVTRVNTGFRGHF